MYVPTWLGLVILVCSEVILGTLEFPSKSQNSPSQGFLILYVRHPKRALTRPSLFPTGVSVSLYVCNLHVQYINNVRWVEE